MNKINAFLIGQELARIHRESETKLLTAAAVVDAARDEDSPLHEHFEWDDSVAGEQFRIIQARQIIRAIVIDESRTGEAIRQWVSLPSDRKLPGGGYRELPAVLSVDALREEKIVELQKLMDSQLHRYESFLGLEPKFIELRKLIPRFKDSRFPGQKGQPDQGNYPNN